MNLSKEEIRTLYLALEDKREVLQLTLSHSKNDNPILLKQEIDEFDKLLYKLADAVKDVEVKVYKEFCNHSDNVTKFLNTLNVEQIIAVAPQDMGGYFVWYRK
jgi:histidyl-tRNA synthetase